MNKKQSSNKAINDSRFLLEHAFRQLHSPLYFYALKFVSKSDVAKVIVQDAFLGLLHSNNNENIDNLKAYLYRSVRNNCLNFIKRNELKSLFIQNEQERAEREIQFYDTHETLVEKELHLQVKKAIDELPEPYKLSFILSRIEELKTKEIAEKLNIPIRTVETQIYRALKIL